MSRRMQRPRVGPLGPVGAIGNGDVVVSTDIPKEIVLDPVRPHRRRRRRPSGEAPPLPRPLRATGKYWLVMVGVVVAVWMSLVFLRGAGVRILRIDMTILEAIAWTRNATFTSIARAIDLAGSEWTIRALRWMTLLGLLAFKRFRHLFVWLGSLLAVGWITTTISIIFFRARPGGVGILGHWEGSAHPARPVATLAVTLMGITYTLVPPGRYRNIAKWATFGILHLFALSRLYLAVDHPTDAFVAITLGIGIPLVMYRLLTPNEVFPVAYKKGRAAHLDVGGARGAAIKAALEDQLGISVSQIKPFNLEGSGGSTPLRLEVDGAPENGYLFAKLYASNHLRADRWYKLGRTLLYGRLEDEASFSTVRRLVQYEDYMLRVMRDAGLNTPIPYGFVEITPEREYLLVTSFLEGGKEIHEVEVDTSIIDEGLGIVRQMWDSGIAHRDIKPSNLLVGRGRVHMIDVAFGQIRPSPWRQAVDLANMMLVLALRTDAERVYRRALRLFSPDEIAEAFAATQSVTIPSQSRNMMKHDNRRLVEKFRRLAPARPPISIQRWSIRRVGLTVSVIAAAALALMIAVGNLQGAGLL